MNIILAIVAAFIIAIGIFGVRRSNPPTSSSIPAPTSSPAPAKSVSSNYSDWTYPNSSVVSSGQELVLNSSDSPDAVTGWYRGKINSSGYNIRNSVKTSANDVVKNVISAVGNGIKVSVEITRNPGDSATKIEVELSSL